MPQLPITTDYGAAKMFLQALNTDMLSSQGTAIDAAINLASTYFDDEEQTNRVVFIPDGEDHAEDGTIDAAQAAMQCGLKSLPWEWEQKKVHPFQSSAMEL